MSFNGRWRWYATEEGVHDAYCCESRTRDEVLANAQAEFEPGQRIQIVEAVMSQAQKYEGSDFVPFIRERNHEVLTLPGEQA